MSERTEREFLSDIREAIQRISAYVAGVEYVSFVQDTKTQDVVIRNLEILGEATKNLSENFRTAHAGVPLTRLAAEGHLPAFFPAARPAIFKRLSAPKTLPMRSPAAATYWKSNPPTLIPPKASPSFGS